MGEESGRRVRDGKVNIGEWIRWGASTLVIGLSVYYGLQTRIAVIENQMINLVPRVFALESKYDSLIEMSTDIKWIKRELEARKK